MASICPSTASFDLVADELVELELKIQAERKVAPIYSFKQIKDYDDATMLFFRAHYTRMEAIEKDNQI